MENKGELLRLSWRLLDEEIEVINQAYKSVAGGKLVYAADKTLLVRFLSRNKVNLLIRFAEKITDKKLVDIDFRENQIDWLKVRIIIRKYLAKTVFKFAFIKFYADILQLRIFLNKQFD
jgi:hypothetical protein